MKGRTKLRGRRKYLTPILIAALVISLAVPMAVFAAISPLPSGNVGEGGSASNAFSDARGKYSTWESPSSGFAVAPEYAYRFKQGDAVFKSFGKLDSKGGKNAADDRGYPDTSSDSYYMFPVGSGDNTKGKIGFTAEGLKIRNPVTGIFDLVDMTVTVTDWTLAPNADQPFVMLQKHSRTNVIICDVKEAKVKFEYFASGTSKRYTVKANLTYNDVDNQQYVGVKPSDTAYMYADKASKLSYAKVDGYFVYHASDHYGNDTSGTPRLAFGITYQTDVLDLVFGTNENMSNGESWSYFGQYAYTMANIVPSAPVKLVSDTDEKEVTSNTLKTPAETFTYKIVQPVPSGLSNNMFYSIFRFEDQIDTCLEIMGVAVTQEGHGDKTGWFDITTNGNNVVASAKASALGDEDFYGGASRNDTEFTLNIKVRIDPSKDEQMHAHGHYNAAGDLLTFTNIAKTVISNNVGTYGQDTNIVTTRVALPGKTVSDSDEQKVAADRIINANEIFTYRVRQAILGGMDGAGRKYSSFELADELDSCVNLLSAKVVRDDGADAGGQFGIAVSGNKVTATAKAEALSDPGFYGGEGGTGYTLLIEAALDQTKTVADLKAHGHYSPAENEMTFPNQGVAIIDGSPMTSNEVITKVGVPDLSITKAVNRYEHQVGDRVHYTVTVKHTAKSTSDATSAVIKDVSLPDGFALDPQSLKVGGIATANNAFETAAGGFMFKTDLIKMNETAVITFDAIPDKRHNGTIIGNTASVTAYSMTEEKKADASVYINSPKLDLAKTTHKAEYKVGDTISYSLVLTQANPGTFMRDIIISDSITHGGIALLPGSIQILDENGRIITHLCDITVSGNAFDVATHLNMGYEDKVIPPKAAGIAPYTSAEVAKKLTVAYDVAVSGPELSGLNVRNTAISPSRPNTNGELVKDDPDIPSGGDAEEKSTPVVGAKLKIEKSSDKDIYEVSDTAKYTLKATQIREDYTARNVVVSDAFETTLASIKEGSVKVTLNKKDITSESAIALSGGALEITTGKDLAWGDAIIVTYHATFDPAAVGEVVANVAIARADNADETQDENAVGVEIGKAELKIIKTSDKKTYNVGDIAKYTIDISCVSSAPAINVAMKDSLDTTGASILADSVRVVYNGKDITSGCAITAGGQTVRIETGKPISEGESLIVAYDVPIESPDLAGKDIGNIAVATSSNSEDAEDGNTVSIAPVPENEPGKETSEPASREGVDTPKAGDTPKTGDSPLLPALIAVMIAGLAGTVLGRLYIMKKAGTK